MSKLLEISDLYGGYERGVNVLQGISLSVEEKEAVGIVGQNGTGKSTLGKAIINQLPHRRGSIVFKDQPIEDKSTYELAQMGIALMHQGGVVFPNLSVWQNIQLAFGTDVEKDYYKRLKSIIPLLQHFEEDSENKLKYKMADKLSGGQRHELALAMTLARQPKLVVLDEPSAGLAPVAVDKMYEVLEKIRTEFGITFLLIEQNVQKAILFCSRCLYLQQGAVVGEFKGELGLQDIERKMFNKELI